jgi:hypothetical protein
MPNPGFPHLNLPAKTTSILTGLLTACSLGTTGTTTPTSGIPGRFFAIHPHRWGSKRVVLFSYNRESAFLALLARFWHLICEVNSSSYPHMWWFYLVFWPLPPTCGGQRDLFLFFLPDRRMRPQAASRTGNSRIAPCFVSSVLPPRQVFFCLLQPDIIPSNSFFTGEFPWHSKLNSVLTAGAA